MSEPKPFTGPFRRGEPIGTTPTGRFKIYVADLESQLAEAQGKLEAVREAWEFVEFAWIDTDVHPRHAPDKCDSCDAFWAMLMVIRDAILGESEDIAND